MIISMSNSKVVQTLRAKGVITVIFAILIALLVLSGCSKKSATTQTKKPVNNSSKSTKSTKKSATVDNSSKNRTPTAAEKQSQTEINELSQQMNELDQEASKIEEDLSEIEKIDASEDNQPNL